MPDLGDLRRLEPISRSFGFDRGQPVDHHYIARVLAAHAADIRGHVLEIGDDGYTRRFGADRVTRSDVLDHNPENRRATIVADLARADEVEAARFDCAIVTQTLHLLFDVPTAIRTLHRLLRPGGVLLLTVPGISQICGYDLDRWGDDWRFTTASVARLAGDVFGPERMAVASHGNVLAAIAFLHGLAAEELTPAELDHLDPDYQLLITARAVKAPG